MSIRPGFIAMMLLVIASSAAVSASEQVPVTINGDYIVEPVHDADKNSITIKWVYATITQGMQIGIRRQCHPTSPRLTWT
jgi:Skp family chaperone for outer membrane proteins